MSLSVIGGDGQDRILSCKYYTIYLSRAQYWLCKLFPCFPANKESCQWQPCHVYLWLLMSAFLKINFWNFRVKGSLPVGLLCQMVCGSHRSFIAFPTTSKRCHLSWIRRFLLWPHSAITRIQAMGLRWGAFWGVRGPPVHTWNPGDYVRLHYKAKGALELWFN